MRLKTSLKLCAVVGALALADCAENELNLPVVPQFDTSEPVKTYEMVPINPASPQQPEILEMNMRDAAGRPHNRTIEDSIMLYGQAMTQFLVRNTSEFCGNTANLDALEEKLGRAEAADRAIRDAETAVRAATTAAQKQTADEILRQKIYAGLDVALTAYQIIEGRRIPAPKSYRNTITANGIQNLIRSISYYDSQALNLTWVQIYGELVAISNYKNQVHDAQNDVWFGITHESINSMKQWCISVGYIRPVNSSATYNGMYRSTYEMMGGNGQNSTTTTRGFRVPTAKQMSQPADIRPDANRAGQQSGGQPATTNNNGYRESRGTRQ